MVMVMAEIYSRCGKYDEAIDELDYALSLECSITTNSLKFKPWVDPMRDLPRFKELMRRYAYRPTT